jgi:rhodanese-related sulfurtransferase
MMQPNKLLIIALCGLALIGSSCRWTETAPQASEEKLVLVNVLGEGPFNDCHIKIEQSNGKVESIFVEMDDLEKYAQEHWNKEKTHVVVYCANYKCLASAESAKMLKELGFKNAWAYEGGIAEWKNLGFPVTGACQEKYLNDYAKPEGYKAESDVPVITAEELKEKIDSFKKKS